MKDIQILQQVHPEFFQDLLLELHSHECIELHHDKLLDDPQ